jgi:L-amino acid N-acyltransferase YncA
LTRRANARYHVRRAELADAERIAHIYNQGIRGRGATFETTERTRADIEPWLEPMVNDRYPVLVATRDSDGRVEVGGWIRASAYRPRACYAGIGDFSVYVDTALQRRGVGDALLAAFLPVCAEAGLWKLVSRIFPENTASLALCARHGFRTVGTYERHAQLDGAWRDVVVVECLL